MSKQERVEEIEIDGRMYYSWDRFMELEKIKSRKTIYNRISKEKVVEVKIGASSYYAKNDKGAAPSDNQSTE